MTLRIHSSCFAMLIVPLLLTPAVVRRESLLTSIEDTPPVVSAKNGR